MWTPSPSSDRRRPRRAATITTNYSESQHDDILDDQLGPRPRRRFLTPEARQRETETEAMIALSLGFPIEALLDNEPKPSSSLNDYIVIRNHILAQWRANARSFLTKSQVKETVSSNYDQLISSAYDFLRENGYINFGVSPAIRAQFVEEPDKGSVVIVGAGLAGLAAARQLLSFGFRVLVIEGRDRPGGRVYTKKMGKEGKYAAVDLGGSVITGIHANPLGVLARQLGIPLHKIRDNCPLFRPDGSGVDGELDVKVDLVFNKLLEHAAKLREFLGEAAGSVSLGCAIEKLRKLYGVAKSVEERQILNWHLANLEYANAGCVTDLSLAHWDQDDPFEMGGDHCFLAGGNWRLINSLCEDVPILYQKRVTQIEHGDEGVEVTVVGGQVFRADMVLCTVPLGVLKAGNIKFNPELPKHKLDAIQRLGFGLLNKVAMVFPHVFWGEELDTFGCFNEDHSKRGEFFLFYGYHTVSGGAVLIALVAGEAAVAFEETNPLVSLHKVLDILRGIYGPKGVNVPDPIQTVCTRWGSDPLCQGSYSHVRVGSSGKDYDILAESIGGRLFFAGEATTREHPATMHGALLSGFREASRILHAWRSKETSTIESKKLPQKNLRLYNEVLLHLFEEPDLAFGIFSFVFGPLNNEDLKATGLMKITFATSKSEDGRSTSKEEFDRHNQSSDSHLQPLQLYSLLSREQVDQITLVDGDDINKLELICKKFGLKLMGSDSICSLYGSFISSISGARKGRSRLPRGVHSKLLS